MKDQGDEATTQDIFATFEKLLDAIVATQSRLKIGLLIMVEDLDHANTIQAMANIKPEYFYAACIQTLPILQSKQSDPGQLGEFTLPQARKDEPRQ